MAVGRSGCSLTVVFFADWLQHKRLLTGETTPFTSEYRVYRGGLCIAWCGRNQCVEAAQ